MYGFNYINIDFVYRFTTTFEYIFGEILLY